MSCRLHSAENKVKMCVHVCVCACACVCVCVRVRVRVHVQNVLMSPVIITINTLLHNTYEDLMYLRVSFCSFRK